MSRELVVDDTGFGVRGALLDGGRLIELIDVDEGGADVTDRLFRARVDHLDRHLNAAFLDHGGDVPGFLAAKDARYGAGVHERRPIQKLVNEGQWLIVQGLREPDHGKGSRVTTDLKLFGLFLVYRPHGTAIEASVKIRGRQRDEMLARGQALFGENRGVLMRQQAADVDDTVLLAEFEELEGRWQKVETAFRRADKAQPLDIDEAPLSKLLRQVLSERLDIIRMSEPALIAEARTYLGRLPATFRPTLDRLSSGQSAVAQTGIDEAIARDFSREIALDRGGQIIIEETAALTAIDVDGGHREAQDVDLDAAREIARLVRLRQLGGTIVVDFVDLPTKPQRQQLEDAFKRAFKGDPAPVQIYPMSPLGLVQLSRARRGRRWSTRWHRPCPHCAGEGQIPSLRRQAEKVLAAMRGEAAPTAKLLLAPDLHAFMQRETPKALQMLSCRSDPTLAAGEFALEPER